MGLFLFLLLLFAAVFVAIRFPGVQTRVAQEVAAYLSDATKHEVSVGQVDIEFFTGVVLEQLQVKDNRQQELFYVGRAKAGIDAFSIFSPNNLSISTLELQEPRANLVKYEGSDSLNLTSFISAMQELFVKDTTKVSKPFNFELGELIIENGKFTYDDFNYPRTEYGMDYRHLAISNLSGKFDELQLEDTLKVTVTDLQAIETNSDTRLHNLDTRMTYAATFWDWEELDLQLNKSNLQNHVRFDYSTFGNFAEFMDSVTMTASLQDSKVYSQDIAVFAPQLRDYYENLQVNSLNLKGLVKNFSATEVDLEYGRNTHIVGSINADGLPNFKETFANLRLKPSTINANDLKQFLPQEAYQMAVRLGTVRLEGRFLGFYNDFVANGEFGTALGNLRSDINLKIDDDTRTSSYSGFVTTNGFNLGRLLDAEEQIRTISLSGRLQGSGFTLPTANVKANVDIRQVQLLGYNYQNIKADGVLRKQVFTGDVSINDPNLIFTASGEVNLAEQRKAFNMVADLQRIDFQALNLTKEPLLLSANANLNFKGLRLDDFEGTARFDSAFVSYRGNSLSLDSVLVSSEIAAGQRTLDLLSSLLDLHVEGNFNYTTLIADLKALVQEYKLNFESNPVATAAYYNRKPKGLANEYAVNYNLNLKQPNPILELFVPELVISDSSQVEGSFRHDATAILELYATIDTILYDGYTLYGNNIELNTSKMLNNPDVLAAALFTSREQVLPGAGLTQDFFLEGIWSERTIQFATSLKQPQQNNRALITGDLNFLQNQIQIVFDESDITLQQNVWAFVPGNTLYISEAGKRLVFENFALTNQNQVIRAEGTVSGDPDSRLVLNVENFKLNNLNPLLSMKIAGEVTAELTAQDLYDQAKINAAMQVDSFYLDDVFIGNVVGSTDWTKANQRATVDLGIQRNEKKVLALTGFYNPMAEEDQLDLLAVLDQANMKLVEPVLRGLFSNLEGDMEGRIRVLGNLDYPVLKGSVMVTGGQFTFDYLNTTYRFSDRIYFGPNSINFRNAQLQDLFGNRATVSGGIAHDGFQNMVIDMEARYRNFMVLNTTEAQNELFYGTAFATGTASVLGPTENLQVKVDARSEENTRIVLPLDYQTEVSRKDFIRFVNNNPEVATGIEVEAESRSVDLSGINLDFNLDVTDDAYFEIIIDRTTGDVIRGSGNGDIQMTIDTRGDFKMYGTFEILEGAYNLNLLEGLVTREFKVVPGGTITWNGDPTAGVMNITANYTQMASFNDLAPGDDIGGRYPVVAVIELNGPLLTPQIQLGLNFDQLPQEVQTRFYSVINSIKSDESELNRQVFSLLVLQRLSPQGTLAFDSGIGASAVGGSLGSLLSSQLNNFFNSIDSNLEVDIGLGNIGQDALSALQVRLSYTFFQGRLRVTSETGFGGTRDDVGTDGYVGNWLLDYYISQTGELRARLEYNSIPNIYTRRITQSQSISLLHTKRFDNLRELFSSEKRARRQQRLEMERDRIILDSDPRLEL
ncbi:translocation/assembly module TamB domain-containing protein [Pontibacter sp. M82]|uniref:Translocation/assembly module TamB domain-containing protein n=1 Tax=Pontibacter anaerobius TaxID=2993940 RepID=A0ABT3RJ93_9BACT|nr:translocation/assembly module TamB domain-containing protein [Pontibacter anaerobius]MCX2741571.1 translocation/assembly module TamB domain-containing protein [Pontibacter anaerobius]